MGGWPARVGRSYLARRLVTLAPVWIGISFLAFMIGHLAPGDPGVAILSSELGRLPTKAEAAAFDRKLGFSDRLPVQYWHWLVRVLHGNLGTSYRSGGSVFRLLLDRFPATIQLAVASMVLAIAIAIPLGTWAAFKASALPDGLTRVVSVGSAALPSFWVGYLLIITFAVHWHLAPAFGRGGFRGIILPASTIAVAVCGVPLRMVRTSVLEVLHQDYVRTARAAGTPTIRLVTRHVLRNALGPVVTYLGVVFAGLISASVVVETVFAWPGIGLTVTNAIHDRDYPVIQGFVVVIGTTFVLVNLSVDLVARSLDPRIRLGGRARSSSRV